MWATTAAQDKILGLPHRSVHMRVSVDPGGGFVNLSSLEGYDWIVSASWGETVDSSMPDASVKVRHRMHALSMSLLMAGSKLNAGGALLTPGNAIKIETATLAEDQKPVDADYVDSFIGEIDGVDFKKNPIELRCRAEAAPLADTFIETWRVYPDVAGTDDEVQEVAQAIIDDNVTAPPTLYLATGTAGTPRPSGGTDDPSFMLYQYKQQRQPVLNALRVLAGMIGWDVRYKYLTDTGKRELQFYEPGRDLSAIGTLNLTGQPSSGETFSVDGVSIKARTSSPAADEFEIGATVEDTARNIATAVNDGTAGTDVIASRTVDDNVRLMARAAGAAGNSITLTEALSNATVDGAGFLGGTRAGQDVNTTPNYTFGPSQYFDITELALDRSRVRNVIEVVVGVLQSDRTTITDSDSASITQFGRRFAGIAEDGSSQVDTVTEGLRMAQGILSDLKDPEATHAISAQYFWPVELGDVHTYSANGYHYDSDQTLAVVSYRHTVSGTIGRTVILTRGKPSGGVDRWLGMEGRPGVAPPSDLFVDGVVAGIDIASFVGGVRITYDDPRTRNPPMDDWAYSDLHVSTSAAFTPTTSNLVASGRQTSFDVTTLVPGTPYYAKVFAVDSSGNRTLVSSEVNLSSSEVASYHQNLRTEIGSIVPNGEFAVTSLPALEATDPPDNWESIDYASGTPVAIDGWGSAKEVYFDSTEANTDTADRALRIDNAKGTSADPGARSVELVPINGGRPYVMDLAVKSATGSTSTAFLFRIVWYKEDKTDEAGTSTVTGNGTIGSYIYSRNVISAPALARWAQFMVVKTAGIGAGIIYVDRFKMFRGNPAFLVYDSGGQSIPSSSTTTLTYDSESHDHGNNFLTDTFTAPETGDYAFAATNRLASMANGTYALLSIYVDGALSVQGARSYNGSGGSAALGVSVGVPSLRLTAGQLVTIGIFQSDSTSRTATGGQYRFFFSGRRLQ